MPPVLIVPGLHNSGPDHWQSRWHRQHPHWQRITGQPWQDPDLTIWSEQVASWLRANTEPVHIIAHSFGTLASLVAARRYPERVASLFLVAPADPALLQIDEQALSLPAAAPGVIVGSRNDPWMSTDRLQHWQRVWNLPALDAGAAGHINAASGHGDWAEGLRWLTEYWQGLPVAQPAA